MTSQNRTSYRIVLEGELDPSWSDWLNGFDMQATSNLDGLCTTMLRVEVVDQAALRGVLNRIWDMNLELVSLTRVDDKKPSRENHSHGQGRGNH